ncbi:transcriptional regulator, BglG family [Streptococcus pneumoniae]|nr:transcriptional regulator, BglG family [Streptococcus pneumoniae]
MKASSDYDMVFSTIKVETEKPNYLVSVMMTEEQAIQLVELVLKDFPNLEYGDFEIEQILNIVKRYGIITQELELRLAFQSTLSSPS